MALPIDIAGKGVADPSSLIAAMTLAAELARQSDPEGEIMDGDKDAIRELLHQYCFHMDEGRFAELAALFAADGEWIAPIVPPGDRGDHGVADAVGARFAAADALRDELGDHGDGRRSDCEVELFGHGGGSGGPVPSVCGSYADQSDRVAPTGGGSAGAN